MSWIDRLRRLFGGGRRGVTDAGARSVGCHEALALVQEFLDGELEDLTTSEVKAHFDVCQQCYPHLRLEGVFRETIRRVTRGETAPPELRDRVKALLARVDAG